MDYSRSFVIQGGPFIGKGGFYVGRVAREAMPSIPSYSTGKAFRVGFALRIGLGREVQKGPMSASLGVSVYGRFEGLIARKYDTRCARGGPGFLLGDRGYYIWIQGEVGIILEIEGRVDLKLIQAKLLVRARGRRWRHLRKRAADHPVCADGSEDLARGGDRQDKDLRQEDRDQKVRVGYETELRYEWVLPARFPETFLASRASAARVWKSWRSPISASRQLRSSLRLLLDISRSIDGGARAVLIPSAFLYDAPVPPDRIRWKSSARP